MLVLSARGRATSTRLFHDTGDGTFMDVDPILELHDSMGELVGLNDDWEDNPIRPPTDPRESAL
jgi:hypothetical protein